MSRRTKNDDAQLNEALTGLHGTAAWREAMRALALRVQKSGGVA